MRVSQFSILFSVIAAFSFDNSNIHDAVNLWIADAVEAEEKYGHISVWNVSQVTDMSHLFKEKSSFNDDISGWDVSNVVDMTDVFPR